MTRRDFPYLMEDIDRHGNRRAYVRRAGKKIRIHADVGTPEFARAYADALDELLSGRSKRRDATTIGKAEKGTWRWLASEYFASRGFLALDPKSQAMRRGVIEECLREPVRKGSKAIMAHCPLAKTTAAHVQMLIDRKAQAGKNGAANNRKKYLSAMFGWAVRARYIAVNPCRDAERISYATDGFHTWTVEEVQQFWARHPIGTKARVAIDLLLFTGARRGDVVTLGRQHIKDGVLRYVPAKTRYKRLRAAEKPVLPQLAATLAAGPCGDLTFLVTEYGRPFTPAGFGNWFRARCNEAGLPHCSAHGLKKAGATIAAENGATVPQLMAMFDWDTITQAQVYIDRANRKRLAAQAGQLIHVTEIAPPFDKLPHRSPSG